MRILHTGDWHVGATLHRRQRLEEVREALAEVVELAAREQVDLVLVCGDIFEQYAPSAEAERIAYRALLDLRDTGAEVVAIAGNHDNAKRLAAIAEPFAAAGVHLIAEPRRPEHGGVLELQTRGGERAQVACLPWIPERAMFGAEEMMRADEAPYTAYSERLAQLLKILCAGLDPAAVTLLAAHLFVSGARLGGGERELTSGQLFAIKAAALPPHVQYTALGHVHRPQAVPGAAAPARYAGSLLALDFGETAQQKSVTLVEAEPGLPARARELPLRSGRRLRDIAGTLAELEALRDRLGESWLRVTLRCDGPAPGLADRVREILPGALAVRLDYPRQDPAACAQELRRLTPRQLFERYWQEAHGAPLNEQLARAFEELYEETSRGAEEAAGAPA
jgi:exonuclease SbcD